jgi:hypothetical protein
MVTHSTIVTQEQAVRVSRVLRKNDFGKKMRDVVANPVTLRVIKEVLTPPDAWQNIPLSEEEVATIHNVFRVLGFGTEQCVQLSDSNVWGEIRSILFPKPSGNT